MTAGRKANNNRSDYGTPKKYANAISEFFDNNIQLDPCSNEFSLIDSKVKYILPENDGLKCSWDFSTIYVNPPYGRDKINNTSIYDWLCRCCIANIVYESEVLALVPVATNTQHWKDNIFGKSSAVCFLYDSRVKFLINGVQSGTGAPMPCAIIYWGNRFDRFFNIFGKFGAVVDLRHLIKKKKINTVKQLILIH